MNTETYEPEDEFDRAFAEAFEGMPEASGRPSAEQRAALKELIRIAAADEAGDDADVGAHPFDSTREFLAAARDAFPSQDWDPDRLLALREAIGLIAAKVRGEADERPLYGREQGSYGTPPKREDNGRKRRRGPSITVVLATRGGTRRH